MAVASTRRTVQSAEVIVLLQLCYGFLFSILSIWGRRTRSSQGPITLPLMGSLLRLSVSTLVAAYSVWFWFSGVQSLNGNGCPSYIFLLFKAQVRGGVSLFLKIQSVFFLILYGILFIWEASVVFWFYISTATLTTLAVLAFTMFKVGKGHWTRVRGLKFWVTKGAQMSAIFSWAWANGKQSAGPKRPDLLRWIFLAGTVLELCFWATAQYLFLFVFKASPLNGLPHSIWSFRVSTWCKSILLEIR
jgi:hypothetical protein